jgi:hypothetical protein
VPIEEGRSYDLTYSVRLVAPGPRARCIADFVVASVCPWAMSMPTASVPLLPSLFDFSCSWVTTDKQFERRFDRYLDNNFFEHQIHW